MKKQTNVAKRVAAKSKEAKTADWMMDVKSFEKNGCMINYN